MKLIDPPQIFTGYYAEHDDDCACPDKAFTLTVDYRSIEFENDCACSDGAHKFHYSLPMAQPFVQISAIHTSPLPHDFHLAFSPYAPGGPSVLNAAAWQRLQAFAAPQVLSQPVDADLARQHLIHPKGQLPQPQAQQSETLTAWLHITNACNLDCPYCYVRKSSSRMDKAVGLEALEAIFQTAQKHGFRRVKLKYAGGEATLHFELVRRLHQRATQLSRQTKIALAEVVLSNGVHWHTQDAEWLAASGIKLMISLDGIGELHNQLRPLPNHTKFDTFSRIEHTIDRVFLPLGIKPDVTMTVTSLNAQGAADVAKWALIDRDLPLSFNFYRQNALSASRAELNIEEQTLIDGMLSAYAVIEKELPKRPFLNGLLDRVQAEAHTHTCGVGQNYLVITHTGQLAQCQMHLEQPVSDTLNHDLLPMVNNGPLQNHSVHKKDGCQSCEFRYRCSGGCPLETYRSTGRWDVQSPNCNIYKTLYPEALRLEGLRLLKVHGYLH